MEIKDIIKTRRLQLGLTLDEVARIVGVSAATISRWESGDIKNMRRDKISKLSDALDISPTILMGWEDQEYTDEEIQKMAEEHELYNYEKARELLPSNIVPILDYIYQYKDNDYFLIEITKIAKNLDNNYKNRIISYAKKLKEIQDMEDENKI